jgi:predicted ATPase
MWVEEISLENIKCFEKQSLRLGTKTKPYPWITLLGENGTGKSTVLQAIALLLAGPDGAKHLMTPYAWLLDESKKGVIRIRLQQGEKDGGEYLSRNYANIKPRESNIAQEEPALFNEHFPKTKNKVKSLASSNFEYSLFITGQEKIKINDRVYSEPMILESADENRIIPWLQDSVDGGTGWFGAGYGAFRRLTREDRITVPSSKKPLRHTNFYSQFKENEPLAAFHIWLVYLDYKISKTNDPTAKRQLDWGIKAINQLLPAGNSFDSIDAEGRIWFKIGNNKVSTSVLSDGFRSIMALAGDLVWRLIEAFPDSNNPLHEEGVVLIDELDIHLHPTWQRQIAGLLRRTFPNLQFITATHSPIIAAGAGQDAVSYRFYRQNQQVRVEKIKNIHAMSIDQVLQSEAFGLVSVFSEETQKQIDRYYALKRKAKLKASEEKELQDTLPFVEMALGYGVAHSEEDRKLNEFIKQHWK